jgi:heme/copper-type cytochrome/quinol oxidase subunit 2
MNLVAALFIILTLLAVIIGGIIGVVYLFMLWYRNRDREKQALDSTLIQVTVPR